VAKADLGTKRTCPVTGKKFYDLNKNPVISPYTGEIVPIAPVAPPRGRTDTSRASEPEPADVDTDEELVSLEEADAEESTGKVKTAPESEDDIEVDDTLDDDDDDSTFIPEDEEDDEDVTDIIGDVGNDEET
jgi:uncharacterized protein (TIGR02300 family)